MTVKMINDTLSTDRELIVRNGKLYWQYFNGEIKPYENSDYLPEDIEDTL